MVLDIIKFPRGGLFPLYRKYPMLTPFQFASNTPIQAIDLDGLEAFFVQLEARVSSPIIGLVGPFRSWGYRNSN